MAIVKLDSKMVIKRSTNAGETPTIGPSNDHTDGTWTSTNIYEGEFFWNSADEILYLGNSSGVTIVNSNDFCQSGVFINEISGCTSDGIVIKNNNSISARFSEMNSRIGGFNTNATGNYSAVVGGTNNGVEDTNSFISGGQDNISNAPNSCIIGGNSNQVVNANSVIVAGVGIISTEEDTLYTSNLSVAENVEFLNIPVYDDDADAGGNGLATGKIYQTSGAGAAPLNVAGILMVKQ